MTLIKTIFQWLRRVFIPPAIDVVNPDTDINVVLAQAQERILTALLRFAAVVALIALSVVFGNMSRKGRWDIIILDLTVIVIIWLFGIKRTINLKVRSWFFVSLVYLLGVVDMAVFGIAEDWRLFLFGFSILAAMLLGWRASIFATLLSAVSVVVIGSQISSGRIVITASGMSSPIPDAEDISTFTVMFLMIVGVIVTAVGALLREFGETSLRERRAAQLLQQERDLLEQRVADRTRELKERNDELEHSRQLAEAANQAKTVFLANMSHELRTPLNGILGYAQILKRDEALTAEQDHGLDIIYQSGTHLKTLINDILDLSRIEAGKIELYPADIYLPNFLGGIVGIIQMRAEQKNLQFIFQTDDQLPTSILADGKRLRQVLLNLLGNAIKFTDTGQVTFWVTCEKSDPTPISQPPFVLLRFEVTDTGIGISAAELESIFRPFEQVGDVSRRAGGAGLGLSITRQLVELMGGVLNVTSQPGVGSTFWFQIRLPVTNPLAAITSTKPYKFNGYPGKGYKILVAEDDMNSRNVLGSLLTSVGFQVIEAENGRLAVASAAADRPHLILMDLVMPEVDGYQAITTIRQSPDLYDMKVVAVSANAAEQDRERCRQMGFNGFLAKPLDEQELFDILADQLPLTWGQPIEAETSTTSSPADPPMVVPPLPDLQILYELAMFGSMERIEEKAAQLDELDDKYLPFTNRLRSYTRKFDDERIIELIKAAMEQAP